jgi:hypothetical protein
VILAAAKATENEVCQRHMPFPATPAPVKSTREAVAYFCNQALVTGWTSPVSPPMLAFVPIAAILQFPS